MEYVVLVDQNDQAIGEMEKMEAHEKGMLHRAFSIFIFNAAGQMLLQQRAHSKYHSGGLWTNTCCSHPRPKERVLDAAHRRLGEEMGFDCELFQSFEFIYETQFDNGLTEHELDHVISGVYDGKINPNQEEVEAYKYVDLETINNEIERFPEHFTVWFVIAYRELMKRRKV